jgi:hypothetical protein
MKAKASTRVRRRVQYDKGEPLPFKVLSDLPDGSLVWCRCNYKGNPNRLNGVFRVTRMDTHCFALADGRGGVEDFTQTDPDDGICREELAGADTQLYYAVPVVSYRSDAE